MVQAPLNKFQSATVSGASATLKAFGSRFSHRESYRLLNLVPVATVQVRWCLVDIAYSAQCGFQMHGSVTEGEGRCFALYIVGGHSCDKSPGYPECKKLARSASRPRQPAGTCFTTLDTRRCRAGAVEVQCQQIFYI